MKGQRQIQDGENTPLYEIITLDDNRNQVRFDFEVTGGDMFTYQYVNMSRYADISRIDIPAKWKLIIADWHEPAYPLRIKATVEILNPTHPQAVQIHMFYNYMKAQGLPEHTKSGIKYVYVNEIDPAHQDFFDLLQEVESEKRPEPEDFE